MKKLIGYLFYVAVLLVLIYYGVYYLGQLSSSAMEALNPLAAVLFGAAFPIIIGIYLAIPEFINMLGKSGKVKFNWQRFVILGIPALLINISVILYLYTPLGHFPLLAWLTANEFVIARALLGLIFGYTLLTSIYKAEEHYFF